jgi:hypothetical protein
MALSEELLGMIGAYLRLLAVDPALAPVRGLG